MTRTHATSLIALAAAAAIALAGCDTLNGDGADTALYALDATSPQELADAVRAADTDAAGTSERIGAIDGATGEYRFGNGLVIDPAEILDVDAEDLAAPKRCAEDGEECAEGGVVPADGWPEGSCWIFEETDEELETVCAGCCAGGVCFEICEDVE